MTLDEIPMVIVTVMSCDWRTAPRPILAFHFSRSKFPVES